MLFGQMTYEYHLKPLLPLWQEGFEQAQKLSLRLPVLPSSLANLLDCPVFLFLSSQYFENPAFHQGLTLRTKSSKGFKNV